MYSYFENQREIHFSDFKNVFPSLKSGLFTFFWTVGASKCRFERIWASKNVFAAKKTGKNTFLRINFITHIFYTKRRDGSWYKNSKMKLQA